MNESAKEILAQRFAKGELSESEYTRMLNTIETTPAASNAQSSIGSIFGSIKNAIKDHLDNQPGFRFDIKQPPQLSDSIPFEVTSDFVMYKQCFVYKGQKVPYSQIKRLDYIAESDTINAVNNSLYSIAIFVDGMKPIRLSSITILIGRSQKGKRISDAYQILSRITFQERMASHFMKMKDLGYTTIEDVQVFPNGDLVQGGTKANLKEASKKGFLRIGTFYSSKWSADRSSDPYEIIVGNDGTGFLSSRVRFRLTQNQDVSIALLRHLSETH